MNTCLMGGRDAADAEDAIPSAASRLIASTTTDSLFRIDLIPRSVSPRWTASILLDEGWIQPVRAVIP